jgi:hypothetical protein
MAIWQFDKIRINYYNFLIVFTDSKKGWLIIWE